MGGIIPDVKTTLALLLAGGLIACGQTDASVQRSDAAPSLDAEGSRDTAQSADAAALVSADTAVLAWAAFACSTYADMAGKPQDERERLFRVGYDNGKRFLDAARRGEIRDEEIRSKVPIGITMNASGPSTDFALGRIYEVASTEAYDRVVKRDASGLPLPAGKWQMDSGAQKMAADTEYRNRNCGLLK